MVEIISSLKADVNIQRCFYAILNLAKFNSIINLAMLEGVASNGIIGPAQMPILSEGTFLAVPHIPHVITGQDPTSIEVQIISATYSISTDPESIIGMTRGNGMAANFVNQTVGAIFSIYIDQVIEWAKNDIGNDYHNWPKVLNFCRVVRNACIHGGTVNISSPKSPGVKWRGIKISHADCGRKILDGDILAMGDLYLLLFDLEREMCGLGAPNPLP